MARLSGMRAFVIAAAILTIILVMFTRTPHSHPVANPVQRTQSHGERLMSNLIRARVSRRLREIEGGDWYTLGRCVSLGPLDERFRCAVWSQNVKRTQDFWRSVVDVRCSSSLTECTWRARRRIEAQWKEVTS